MSSMPRRSHRPALGLATAGLLLASLLPTLMAEVAVEVVPAGEERRTESDTIIATPWDVRREAQELMHDLADGRVELSILLDRTQQLLREHGNDLIGYEGGWVPLAEALRRHLADHELLDDYAGFFRHVAARELDELLAQPEQSLSALAEFGNRYPGTPAAQRAWRLLADRAWDLGHLGLYLTYAPQAGDRDDPQRRQRLQAARTLLLPPVPDELPESLDNLGKMWSIAGIPNHQSESEDDANTRRLNWRRRQQQVSNAPTGFLFNHHAGVRVAACDGSRLVLLDPLLGNQIGDTIVLANNAGAVPRAPAYGNGTFVALTLNNGTPRLVAIDDNGREIWASDNAGSTNTMAISDPVIVADIVAFAYTRIVDSYAEVHAAAFSLDDGSLRWRRLIAKGHSPQRHRFSRGGSLQSPDICAHQGSLVVLSNNGLIARLAPTGVVTRIWNYPSVLTRTNRFDNQNPQPPRLGNILSDGRHIVVAPNDHNGLIIIDPVGDQQRHYTHAGSTDQLVDCLDGRALLVGQRLTLLDVAKADIVWSHFGQSEAKQVDGFLGPNRAVAALDNKVFLLDPATGRRTSARAIPRESNLSLADGVLITAGPDPASGGEQIIFIGYGDEHGFERLLAKAENNPDDFRPLLALASLHRARGDIDAAYQAIMTALDRGAPSHHAREAGRLVRLKISRTLGAEAFAEPLAMFERLESFAPSLRSERLWWEGRHAELTGAVDVATRSYLAVLAEPTSKLAFINGLRADLHALASAGLNRLGTGLRPGWLQSHQRVELATQPEVGEAILEAPTGGEGFLETPVVADGIIYGYRGGHLQAYDVASGEVRWRRSTDEDDMPMLGVYLDRRRRPDQPIQIGVIPGSAAAVAGLRDGDVLLELNSVPLEGFHQLSQTVARVGIGGDFTLMVKRSAGGEDDIVTVSGKLGSALWRPLEASERFVVIRSITIRRDDGGNWATARDGQNPVIEVLDRATGAIHWRRELQTATSTTALSDPLLVDDRLLVVNDGQDLLAFDLEQPAEAPIWQRRGAGINTTRVELINDHLLAITRPESGMVELVEAETGNSLFDVPADPAGPVLLHEGSCFVHDAAGHLQCWDLGIAYDSWRSETRNLVPLAVHRKSLFVKDRRRQLRVLRTVNGREIRRFDEWTTVHEACLDGDRLYLYGHRDDGRQVIAAVALRSGSLSWERELPYKLELRGRLFRLAGGVGCVLDSLESRPSILGIDKDGAVTHAVQMLPGETILDAGTGGLLLHGPDGLRQPEPLPTAAAAPIQALALTEAADDDLAATIKARADDADWQQAGDSSFACLYQGERLLVLIRSPAGAPDLTLHFSQSTDTLDVQGQLLRARRGDVPQFEAGRGNWSLVKVLHVEEDGGRWISAALLAPPLVQEVGVPLRMTTAQSNGPWWYRPAWRRVERVEAGAGQPSLPAPLP